VLQGADVIRDVEFVVFDEVHYVNDAERGVVSQPTVNQQAAGTQQHSSCISTAAAVHGLLSSCCSHKTTYNSSSSAIAAALASKQVLCAHVRRHASGCPLQFRMPPSVPIYPL
jgi:hypothetical protein